MDRISRGSRVLVVGPSWIGDMIMAQSLFKVLRRRDPDCSIDVLAPEWSRPILRRMPEVREGIPMEVAHWRLDLRLRWRMARRLRRREYDQAVITQRSFKSAVVPWLARIPVRTSFLGESRYLLINDRRPLDEEALPLAVQRFAFLGTQSGDKLLTQDVPFPSLTVEPRRQDSLRDSLGLAGRGEVVGLAPGAEYGPAKRWPIQKWERLARRLGRAGARVWVFGAEKDRALGERIGEAGGGAVRNLAGRTKLEDAADLMALCDAVVTNDTGLMHMAAALPTHVVVLYGCTWPTHAPPLTDRKTIFWLGLECSPCFERECPLGHLKCLRGIRVERVFEAVRSVLAGG